ncbi:hypothetical protein EJ06DRAFT_521268 [Trichodelitschia bisporula]|uniref:RRM domain-containing protein n=1 Tax=Trichodelitschia bisporula TaxID=703511 RepID=A0A6G1I0H7_9PEZI|nr:hypothetical protein EJ06DRAFT_521268 [Trichodelitschia bisporula]
MPGPTPMANGVLAVPAAALQKQAPPNNAPRGPSRKLAAPRLKLLLRRLPPGLTQAELEGILGEEWKVGEGKVDWFEFKPGKVSKDLAKPSRPTRAYFHLTDQAHISELGDTVRQATFHDAKNTIKDPALVGPPSLEFAPYARVPVGKKRNDVRQGTIDQDPEFKDFLESLTNPIPKPPGVDAETTPTKKEEITTTPLIEHLREKKAAKDKPSGVKAGTKHGRLDTKENKLDKTPKGVKVTKDAGTPEKGKRSSKAEKVPVQPVKLLSKESPSPSLSVKAAASPSTPSENRRERGTPMNIAAKIQRDLGIGPAAGRRPRREQNVDPAKPTTAEAFKDSPSAPTSPVVGPVGSPVQAATRPPKRERRDRRGPKPGLNEKTNVDNGESATKPPPKTPTGPAQPTILRKPQQAQSLPPKGPAAQRAPPAPQTPKPAPAKPDAISNMPQGPPIKQAFLKHANPSQGITEALLETALSAFGTIEKVEIDRKKGFAYVDFVDPEGLQRAIAASPVKVAQGAVQVLERRERVSGRLVPQGPVQGQSPAVGQGRGGFRGRGRGGRGGGRVIAVAAGGPGVQQGAVPTAPASAAAPAPAPAPPVTQTQASAPPVPPISVPAPVVSLPVAPAPSSSPALVPAPTPAPAPTT